MTGYEQRQDWDLDSWPEMYSKLKELQALIFFGEPGLELNMMVFTVASLSSGCRHCQAHGAYSLDQLGIELDKIQALWSFESSDLFDDRERTALRFAVAASSVPSGVSAEHHAGLRVNFSDVEVRTLIGVVAMAGFMNRFNDSLATVTDAESRDWASVNLGDLGWKIGKHVGTDEERRSGPPGGG